MSYPVRRCPYCQREMPESDIERAIQKEKEIWRPFNDSWTENLDSTTIDTNDYEIVYLDTKEEG